MAPELVHMREDKLASPWAVDIFRCKPPSPTHGCMADVDVNLSHHDRLCCELPTLGCTDICNLTLISILMLDSFGVLLHEVVSGLRPHPRYTMEPLRCAAGTSSLWAMPGAQGAGKIARR